MYLSKIVRFAPCLALSLYFSQVAMSQTTPVVAEGYLQSIKSDGSVTIRILKVHNGNSQPGFLSGQIASSKYAVLYSGLRRHRTQKWLFTLQYQENSQSYILTSAYGLKPETTDTTNRTPAPLLTLPDKVAPDHLRATMHTYEQQVVEIVNQERWNDGMTAPLKENHLLHSSADGHSESMAVNDFFSHRDLTTCSSFGQRINATGYTYNSAAENIAAGQSTPASVMNTWMNSSGHRTNILNSSYREIGVGYEYGADNQKDDLDLDGNCAKESTGGPYLLYWTQNFGRRNGVFPVVIERELAVTNNRTVELYVYGVGTATSMRFSNDGSNWSGWVPYTPDYTWQLSQGDGTKTVYSQVSTGSNGSGTIYSESDDIELTGSCDPMVFSNTNLNGSSTYNSCEIIADPNVIISGTIIFQAGSVTLGQNVEVPTNATLEIQIQ